MAVPSPPLADSAAARSSVAGAPGLRSGRAPLALLAALLVALEYAAFADGATDLPQESWLQLGLLAVAVAVAAAWLYGGGLSLRASRAGWIGLIGLGLFAAWTAVTIAWSVAPDRSWIEFNRAVAYTLVAALGVALGSSLPRAPERTAVGLAIVVAPVALYALAGKTLPGLRIEGVLDADHAGSITRLRAPLEYWNALALLCVLGLPPMVRVAADPARRVPLRLLGLAGAYCLLVVVGMTYSRGGILALLAGVGTFLAFTTERVRTALLFGGCVVCATVPLGIALTRPELTTDGLPLAQREGAALTVLVALLAAGAVLLAFGGLLMHLERGRRFTPARGRVAGRAVAVAAAALLLIGTANAAATGAFSSAFQSFTDRGEGDPTTDPRRLLSTNSGNRWTWWQEALGAWSDKPVAGWGAGSFPVTHRSYRTELLAVQQPHSVPLQWLAETGVIGLVLAMGALLALLAAAIARVRAEPWALAGAPPGRGYAAALVAAPVAWLAHSFYDWDWDIPAITIPALLAAGVLAARPRRRAGAALWRRSEGGRNAAFAVGVAAVAVAAVSAGLPALAETRTAAALQAVGKARVADEELAEAAADAEFAATLNPLAAEPLFAAASIALRRERLEEARSLILRALDRQPRSVDAWFRLVDIDFQRQDRAGVRYAAQRLLELDPVNPAALGLARRAHQAAAPPRESATATGSPLPTQVPITEPDPAPTAGP